MNLDPLLSPAMDTGLPLALAALSSRLLGVVAIVFGVTVVRFSQTIGVGIANAIIRKPDIITEPQPPKEGLRESATFFGRCIGVFLVPWGALWVVAGGAAVLAGRWG
jgi:hypothetical protein